MTIVCPKAMLVSLCSETHYDLPYYAAHLSRRVTEGKTTYGQLWSDVFDGASHRMSEQVATQYFWFVAGMAAARTKALGFEHLRPLIHRHDDLRHEYERVVDQTTIVEATARDILMAGSDRPLLREFMDSTYNLMADRPEAKVVRRRLLAGYHAYNARQRAA